jgi:hypothetical protein
LRRADDALLLAKRSGRNQIVLHDPETGTNAPVGSGTTTHEVEELLRAERPEPLALRSVFFPRRRHRPG